MLLDEVCVVSGKQIHRIGGGQIKHTFNLSGNPDAGLSSEKHLTADATSAHVHPHLWGI